MASSNQPLTALAMAVLELLHERPMHPYEMTQVMRQRRTDRRVKLRPGSLYHTVERLESQDFLEVVDTQRQGRRPERTVYGITELGRDTYAEQAREMLATLAPDYTPYPMALAAGTELSREDFLEQLGLRVMNLRQQLAADKVAVDHLLGEDLNRMYWVDFAYVNHQRKSELEWTEKLIEDLESGRITWPDEKPEQRPELSIVETKDETDDQAS
ncbi:PadR family transcriptional regulator [Amycolatopsis pigmentata]|uniref:PadR family transcriptional regulator n=1 Tax=Amycolatopsis pigmentata TaxID=450801 RepID=A0ABW5G7E3_9PSEU